VLSGIALELESFSNHSKGIMLHSGEGVGAGSQYLILLQRICISSRNKSFEVAQKLHLNVLYLHPIY